MVKVDEYVKLAQDYLERTATIHIYSFPYFMLETFSTLLILLIYCFLHSELITLNKKAKRLKPNSVYFESRPSKSISNTSVCTSVTRYREIYKLSSRKPSTSSYKSTPKNLSTNSQWGWVGEKNYYAEQLVDLTPEQFVKIDIERKQRERELDNYMTSLSTLCKNVLSKKYSARTLSRQVDMARESLQCNKMSLEGKYLGLKTEAMTKSLFSMLEQMITSSSLQNPLPFKGDITTLALDAADLSIDKPHLNNDMKKWEEHSFTIIDDTADDNEVVSTFKEGNWEKDDTIKVSWKKTKP